MRRTTSAVLLSLVCLLALGLLSGGLSLVQTRGTSMEPVLSGGDLAVVVRTGGYDVGDVVAYRSEMLGITVVHRVIAALPGGLQLQGDNNDFVDPELATAAQVTGRMLFHVPRGGVVGQATQTPWALAAVVLAVLAIPAGRARRRTLGRGRPALSRSRPGHRAPTRPLLRRPVGTASPRPTPPVRVVTESHTSPYAALPVSGFAAFPAQPALAPSAASAASAAFVPAQRLPAVPAEACSCTTADAPSTAATILPSRRHAEPDALLGGPRPLSLSSHRQGPTARPPGSFAETGRASVFAIVAALLLLATGALFALPSSTTVQRTTQATETMSLGYEGPAQAGVTYPDGEVRTGQPLFLGLVDHVDLWAGRTVGSVPSTVPADPAELGLTVTTPSGWTSPLTLAEVPQGDGRHRLDLVELRSTLAAVAAETGIPTDGATVTVTATRDDWTAEFPFALAGGVLRGAEELVATRTVDRVQSGAQPARVTLGPFQVPLGPLRLAVLAGMLVAAAGAAAASRGLLTPTDEDLLARARTVQGGLLRLGGDRTVVEVGTARTLLDLARDTERPLLQVSEAGTGWFVVDDGAVIYRLKAVRSGPGHREGVRTSLRAVEDPSQDYVQAR